MNLVLQPSCNDTGTCVSVQEANEIVARDARTLVGGQALIIVGASGVSAGVRALPPLVVAVKPYVTKKSAQAVFCGVTGLLCPNGPPDELVEDLRRKDKRDWKILYERLRKAETKVEPPKKLPAPEEPPSNATDIVPLARIRM